MLCILRGQQQLKRAEYKKVYNMLKEPDFKFYSYRFIDWKATCEDWWLS